MRWMPACALGAVLVSAGVAAAQQPETEADRRQPQEQGQPGQRDAQRREQGGRAESEKDQMFATCLAIENAAEVQISEFAAERLQNEQAKKFAQEMVRDHRQMLEKLGQFGAEPVTLRTAANAQQGAAAGTGQDRPADSKVQANAQARDERSSERREDRAESRRGGHQVDFVAIKREIAEECVKSAQEELASKPEEEVDRCYMAGQVFGHQHMLDMLKVMERHASPQLKEALAEGSQTTKRHLDHAKEILKTLDKAQPASAAASRATTNR
jgi:predicted outer membrane protein